MIIKLVKLLLTLKKIFLIHYKEDTKLIPKQHIYNALNNIYKI